MGRSAARSRRPCHRARAARQLRGRPCRRIAGDRPACRRHAGRGRDARGADKGSGRRRRDSVVEPPVRHPGRGGQARDQGRDVPGQRVAGGHGPCHRCRACGRQSARRGGTGLRALLRGLQRAALPSRRRARRLLEQPPRQLGAGAAPRAGGGRSWRGAAPLSGAHQLSHPPAHTGPGPARGGARRRGRGKNPSRP